MTKATDATSPAPVVLKVFVTPLRREWCDECLTTSRLEFEVLTPSGVQAVGQCPRCDPS